MISLYKPKETKFETNGIYMNEWTELKVVECLNGEYSISGTYPISSTMKYMELVKGAIIVAPTPSGRQPFRIMTVDRDLEEVSVEGFHIFYDLVSNNVKTGFYVRGNGDTAMKKLLGSCQNPHPFTGHSDITETHQFSLNKDINPLLALFDGRHCLTYMYSGEIYRNWFEVHLLDRIGKDTNVQIRYGKNLLSFANNSTLDNVITRINATYQKTIKDAEENDVVLTFQATVDSSLINEYPVIYTKNISIEDMDNSLGINEEADLVEYVNSYYYDENNVDKPKFSVSVDWIKEHDYEGLELGDTALIHHELYNFEYRLKITKYTYDCVLEDYDELFFGDLDGQIESVLTTQTNDIGGLQSTVNNHTTNIYELNKRLSDLENPVYYPNMVYNSSFGRFNELGKPDFWETTGIVSTLEHLVGQYSLMLQKGQYLKMKDKPIQAYKWLDHSTDFTFRVIGEGTIKVQVLADGVAQDIFCYVDNAYTRKKEFTFNINSKNWFDSKYSVELHPCRLSVVLSIECLEGQVYIDGMMAVPITQGSKLDIQYMDGPMCFNDVMQFRNDDPLDSKVGDMWFRGDI